eukprot:CAMPEP_0114503478 /NCGR_PEP_ID=MMETSP0109-20121206/9670_1 /TAXON_ID=29199 /ORGANISM="Chlorarachnion reptans, Strain CCCM449" /LENGTH=447 /DNA_ID=CAMNT_0001681511 /DNA_START=78 /DNA_END=1421 /DNA_ORIENTATION=+
MSASAAPAFLPGERVQYYSTSQCEWYKATMKVYDARRKEFTVKLDGSGFIKQAPKRRLRPLFEMGDKVEYFSKSKLDWFPATVCSSKYTQHGELEVQIDGVTRLAKNDQLRRQRGRTNDKKEPLVVRSVGPYMGHREKYTQLQEQEMRKNTRNSPEPESSVGSYYTMGLDAMGGGGATSMYSDLGGHDMKEEEEESGRRSPAFVPTPSNPRYGTKVFPGKSATDSYETMPFDEPASNYAALGAESFLPNAESAVLQRQRSEPVRRGVDSSGASRRESRGTRQAKGKLSSAPLQRSTSTPIQKVVSEKALSTKRLHTASVFCMRLLPGDDLIRKLKQAAKTLDLQAGYVQACVGSTGTTVLRPAGVKEAKTFEGKFEIVSLSGTVSKDGCHVHLCVSDHECKTYGGHLMEGTIVRTTAEIVIGNIHGVTFSRDLDDRTGYDELFIHES